MQFDTLTQALETNRTGNRTITYIEDAHEERSVTFNDLHKRALGVLGYLQNQGLARGDQLIIFLSSNEQFIDVFWACLFGGIIPVPVAVGISDEHRNKLIKVFESLASPYLYTDKNILNRLEMFAEKSEYSRNFGNIKNRALTVDGIHDISQQGMQHDSHPDDIAFIQFSSGSTSMPKGVVLTHRNIMANIRGIIEGAHFTERDVSLSWMPLTHDMGLIGFHLNMLINNMDHYLMPTDLFIRRPMLWLLKVSEKHANVLCSPNFGYKHLLKVFKEEKMSDVDLAHVRLIFNGAEPISARLCDQFLGRLSSYGLKRSSMFTVYGLAEASLAVTFPVPGTLFKSIIVDRHSLNTGDPAQFVEPSCVSAVTFVSVGWPVPGCEVKIVGEEREMLQRKYIGHILIKGDNVTKGYYQNPEADEVAFQPGGWLDTGDLGFLTTEGELVVTGRAKEIIFINSQNYFPHDLEAIAQQAETLELGKVVVAGYRPAEADNDELLVFVLFRGALGTFIPIRRRVLHLINEKAGLEATHVIPVKRIPKTTSGKVQRHLLVEDYACGQFEEVLERLREIVTATAKMEDSSESMVEKTLLSICNRALEDRTIGASDNLFEIGASSLLLVQIHEGIEEAFPGRVEIGDLLDYPTIREMTDYLEGKVSRQG